MNDLITNFMHLYRTVGTILLLMSIIMIILKDYDFPKDFRPTARMALINAFWLTLYILSWYY